MKFFSTRVIGIFRPQGGQFSILEILLHCPKSRKNDYLLEREGDTNFLLIELVEGETLALSAPHPLCAYRGINQMGDEKARS